VVSVYPPVGYPGSIWWVPERIQVSIKYPGTRLGTQIACYPAMAALLICRWKQHSWFSISDRCVTVTDCYMTNNMALNHITNAPNLLADRHLLNYMQVNFKYRLLIVTWVSTENFSGGWTNLPHSPFSGSFCHFSTSPDSWQPNPVCLFQISKCLPLPMPAYEGPGRRWKQTNLADYQPNNYR